MSKAKMVLMTALATMAFAASAFAAVPSGYDSWVNVEKPTAQEVREGGYCKTIVKSAAGDTIAYPVNVPKVTMEEARHGGYYKTMVKNAAGDIIAMPNNGDLTITEEQLEEMMRGN